MSNHVGAARLSNLVHPAVAAALLVVAVALMLGQAARAEDRDRGRVEHRHAERDVEHRPYDYDRGPPVIYAPAPVYYGQPPGVSLNLSFPFHR